MKVIMLHLVPKIGKEGDVISVADGYARNYLFPRQLAVAANDSNMKTLEKRRESIEKKAGAIKADAETLAEKLSDKTVTLKGKTGKNSTKLFGAITTSHIAEAVKQQYKLEVDKRRIVLLDPIKDLGEYEVPVNLHHDVHFNLKVVIQTED